MTKAANGKAEENFVGSPITVKAQYTKDLSFENPNIIEVLTKLKNPPQIAVNVNVDAVPLEDNDFEIMLHIRAEASDGDKKLFLVELAYGGIFHVAPEVPKESLQPFVLIECPRILFPFARNIIADVTRDGGMPPVLLNPIDFVSLYHQRMQEEQKGSKKEDKGK